MARGMPRRKLFEYGGFVLASLAVVWIFNHRKIMPKAEPSHSLGSASALSAVVGDPDSSRLLLSVDESNTPPAGPKQSFTSPPALQALPPVGEEVNAAVASLGEFKLNFSEYGSSFDVSRRFKTHMFVATGDEWEALSGDRKVCLGAQTSIDRINWLIKVVDKWSGPVSIALFTPDIEFHISKIYLRYLFRCHPKIRSQVSFHFVFPAEHPAKDSPRLDEVVGEMSCRDPEKVLDFLLHTRDEEMMAWRTVFAYPQNLLRNTAKAGCQTEFTFVPDIDMIPIEGMDRELDKFLRSEKVRACEKCAYVIPTYEISTKSDHYPVNKTDLVKFVKAGKARQFHAAVYTLNQKSSDLRRWEKIALTEELDVAYKVDKYLFKYEPLYVARGDTPWFDERFVGFGMTRNTQVYEMYVAGYEFFVLNNAFTNHWGFQSVSTRPEFRARQQMANNAKFDDFARELNARYGRDPYGMMSKLKSLNLKHAIVAYGPKHKIPAKRKPSSSASSSSSSASPASSSSSSRTSSISSSTPIVENSSPVAIVASP